MEREVEVWVKWKGYWEEFPFPVGMIEVGYRGYTALRRVWPCRCGLPGC